MFNCLDHRRLASFGVVHGLIRRVHDFPLLLEPVAHKSHPLAYATARDDLRVKVAALMDGKHCEDDLVCRFDMPYSSLLELFPEHRIHHIYAAKKPS